ncbi:hypothetical protein TNCV_2136721 [Trichonephila clavipes]|nr:hypothetical protein TNCV_2136721 [Trichonephila clavipes]
MNYLKACQAHPWTARLPDLSRIEHVWDMIRRRLHLPWNVNDLTRKLVQICPPLPSHVSLVHVMQPNHTCRCYLPKLALLCDVDRLPGKREILRWCLNVFENVVVKHLHKSLRLHTSRRRCLRESIRREWSQLRQSNDWDLLHDNAPAYRFQLVTSPKRTI